MDISVKLDIFISSSASLWLPQRQLPLGEMAVSYQAEHCDNDDGDKEVNGSDLNKKSMDLRSFQQNAYDRFLYLP